MEDTGWRRNKYGGWFNINEIKDKPTTNDYMNKQLRKNLYTIRQKANDSIEYETSEEHRNRLIENQNKEKQYTEERDKQLQELYKNPNYSDEEFIKIVDDYNKKINALKQPVLYDESKDRYIKLNKYDYFTDDNKKYDFKQNISNLTEQEENALTNYTSQYGYGSYSNINSYLYKGETNMFTDNSKIEQSINDISNAMKKNRIGGEYQLYRGIEPSKLNNIEVQNAVEKINKSIKKGGLKNADKYINNLKSMVGEEIENKGFMSTSTHIDPNYTSRGAVLVINTKPTDRAIDIHSLSKYGGKQDIQFAAFSKGGIQRESEVLYDKNTNLVVRDVTLTNEGVFFLCDTKQK